MRHFSWCVVLSAIFGVVAGCRNGSKDKAPLAQKVKSEATPLQGRLEAALAILDATNRDNTLVQLAEDAATSRDVEVTKSALKLINGATARDGAAAKCAVRLAELNRTSEATDVARMILDATTRDTTLAKIATGKG